MKKRQLTFHTIIRILKKNKLPNQRHDLPTTMTEGVDNMKKSGQKNA